MGRRQRQTVGAARGTIRPTERSALAIDVEAMPLAQGAYLLEATIVLAVAAAGAAMRPTLMAMPFQIYTRWSRPNRRN